MALYTMEDKRTYAVFLRLSRSGRMVYIREQYNVVEYGRSRIAGDASLPTFIEGLASPEVRGVTSGVEDIKTVEVYDDIRVYDAPPFLTRLSGTM